MTLQRWIETATLSDTISKGLATALNDAIVLADEYFTWHGKGKKDGIGDWSPVTKEKGDWSPVEKESGDWQTK